MKWAAFTACLTAVAIGFAAICHAMRAVGDAAFVRSIVVALGSCGFAAIAYGFLVYLDCK